MANPMHQFEISKIIPLEINGIDVSFTNSSLSIVIAIVLTLLILLSCSIRVRLVPSYIQLIPESIYSFVRSIIKENAGTDALKYAPFIFSIFLFVSSGNILGLAPYNFTFTSHIMTVGMLSITALLFNMIVGIKKRGFGFLRTFMPEGIPWPLAPLIIPIEIISYLSKPFSLTVRLVANMTVGHIMLKILAGFVVALGIAGVIPFIFTTLIVIFEIFIALLQAYIYTVLSCIYLGDAVKGH